MKKRLTMILAGLFLMIGMASAQTRVTGVVVDEFNEPVMGATVKVVGSNATTLTDVDGNFSIQAPSDKSSLTISYIGYMTQTVKAGKNLNITLETDNTELEQVVVVGYGSARKVGSITGQVTTVQSEKLKNAPSASALEALQGQVAGMSVLNSSGVAGDNATSITIHGVGSLGASTAPLYVLDGVPSTSRTIYALNPNDIESITVLKDASATSIYGSLAANGVIYVTTKGGSFNTKASVTVRSQYGWSTLADKSLYKNMMSSQELYNFWKNCDVWEVGDDLDYYLNAYGLDPNVNTDWYNYMQQFNNPQYQNDVTIEGGSDKVAYLIGASQFHQRGTTIGNYYDRYTVRTNINAKPKTWLRTGFNFNFSYDRNERNANWGDSSGTSNYLSGGLSYLLNPMSSARDEYGNVYPYYFSTLTGNLANPHYYKANIPNYEDRYGIIGNFFAEVTPFKGLKLMTRVGDDMYFYEDFFTRKPSYLLSSTGARDRSHTYGYTATITNTAEYSFDLFEDHHFTFLAGQEGRKIYSNAFSASSYGQDDDRYVNLQNAEQSTFDISESASEARFLSYFGRMNYNLLDRYFLDLSIRNDQCSRFGVKKRDATFWAAGALWKIKSEKFMEGVKWVNDLDFKVSYGTQGNSGIGNYEHLGLVARRTNYGEGQAWIYGQKQNYYLTWETQKLFTVGLSGKLFKKLDFEVSWYIRKTEDMLMDTPYAYTTGFSSQTQNVGALENKGFDVRLGLDILRGKDYYFNASVNFNYNWEKITKLFLGKDRWDMPNYLTSYVVGKPVSFYMPIWAGVNPETGEPQWYVPGANKDVTTKTEVTTAFDDEKLLQNTGYRRNAPFNGGFSFNAGWKGLSIATDWSIVLGKHLVNNDAYFYKNAYNFYYMNQHKDVNDFWTPENPYAKYPNWADGYIMEFDSHLLECANFVRLKSLRIGYDLPKSVIGFQNVVKNVKLTFTGRNLLTFTPYEGIDPEVDSNLTYGIAGNSKQYLFGLEVTF